MNRRDWVCLGLILGCFCLTSRLNAQAGPVSIGQAIPVNIKNSNSANAYAARIRQFIQDQLTDLQAGNIPAQSLARRRIIGEIAKGATPSYYDAFSHEWSAAVLPLMDNNHPMRLRLNIAIITSTLAENGNSLELESLIEAGLKDTNAGIDLWMMKSARWIVIQLSFAPVVNAGGKTTPAVLAAKIVPAIVDCVRRKIADDVKNANDPAHPSDKTAPRLSGFIALEAYRALTLRDVPGKNDDATRAMLPPLVPAMLDILEQRSDQFGKLPAEPTPVPGAERDGGVINVLSLNYGTLDPKLQGRIVYDMVVLITNAGQRSVLYDPKSDPNSKSDMGQLRESLKSIASALVVISNSNTAVDSKLSWLKTIPPSATTQDIATHTKDVFATMQLIFHNLQTPPAIPDSVVPAPKPAA